MSHRLVYVGEESEDIPFKKFVTYNWIRRKDELKIYVQGREVDADETLFAVPLEDHNAVANNLRDRICSDTVKIQQLENKRDQFYDRINEERRKDIAKLNDRISSDAIKIQKLRNDKDSFYEAITEKQNKQIANLKISQDNLKQSLEDTCLKLDTAETKNKTLVKDSTKKKKEFDALLNENVSLSRKEADLLKELDKIQKIIKVHEDYLQVLTKLTPKR